MPRKSRRSATKKDKSSSKEVIDLKGNDETDQHSRDVFRFLELPAELRNRVYQLVIPKDQNFVIARYMIGGTQYNCPRPPAIAQVNHQTREEALPIWRSRNIFRIITSEYDMDNTLPEWLPKAGDSGLEHMHLIVKVDDIKARCCSAIRVGRGGRLGGATFGRCNFDLIVELKQLQYEVRIRWHRLEESCKGKEANLENAFAYGKAVGWMSALGLMVGKNLTASNGQPDVQLVDEDNEDDDEA